MNFYEIWISPLKFKSKEHYLLPEKLHFSKTAFN
jgi:hypothetical protein